MNKAFEKILDRFEKRKKYFDSFYKKGRRKTDDIVKNATDIFYDEFVKIVREVAEEFATDTNVVSNGWIPCSERLPEEELEKAKKERGSKAVFPVLATINKKHVVTGEKYTTVSRAFYGCYNDKNFYNSCCDKLDVIAWQPLAEPYKERD